MGGNFVVDLGKLEGCLGSGNGYYQTMAGRAHIGFEGHLTAVHTD